MNNLERKVEELVKELEQKEREQEEVLRLSREIVRNCSKAIKNIHSNEMKKNERIELQIKENLDKILKYRDKFGAIVDHAIQEYCEMEIMQYIKVNLVNFKELPTNEDLKCPLEPYFMGLLDVFGELRREIIEALRKDKKDEAEKYFRIMEEMYETLLPIKFSESLMPGFRKKQDVARMQLEGARSELLRR